MVFSKSSLNWSWEGGWNNRCCDLTLLPLSHLLLSSPLGQSQREARGEDSWATESRQVSLLGHKSGQRMFLGFCVCLLGVVGD